MGYFSHRFPQNPSLKNFTSVAFVGIGSIFITLGNADDNGLGIGVNRKACISDSTIGCQSMLVGVTMLPDP